MGLSSVLCAFVLLEHELSLCVFMPSIDGVCFLGGGQSSPSIN
jgi:hypothetical protein